jgi:hypothetical protein
MRKTTILAAYAHHLHFTVGCKLEKAWQLLANRQHVTKNV